jgi:hypothetical protein
MSAVDSLMTRRSQTSGAGAERPGPKGQERKR